MKKVFLFFGVAAFMAATVLVGCSKKEEASPMTPDMSKTGIIKGKVEANLTTLNDTAIGFYTSSAGLIRYEMVPVGTEITFKIKLKDLTLDDNTNSDLYLNYVTKVKDNGEYEISLPVSTKGLNVDIIPNDFTYNKEKSKVKFSTNTSQFYIISDGTERVKYSTADQNVFLTPGKVSVKDLQY